MSNVPILHPDKYGLILSGPLSQRPPANRVGARAVWICTDQENLGVVYIKPDHASDWIQARQVGMAPSPHGNAHHSPAFAEVGHTHPLSDITGTLAVGWIRIATARDQAVPTGFFWEERLPPMWIQGTAVQIVRAIAYVAQAPSSPIAYTLKLNGGVLAILTIGTGQKLVDYTLPAPVPVSGGEILTVEGPPSAAGATGLDLKVLLRRVRA